MLFYICFIIATVCCHDWDVVKQVFHRDSQPSASGLKVDKGFELKSPSSMGQSYRKSLGMGLGG